MTHSPLINDAAALLGELTAARNDLTIGRPIDLSALDDALRLAPAMRPQSAAEFRSMLGLRSPRADRIRLRLEQGLETTMTDAAGLGEPTTEVLFPERRC